MSELEHLFQPLTIRGLTIPNRVFFSSHGTMYADLLTHLPTERHVHYYEARARAGVGLISMEPSNVSPHSIAYPRMSIADRDDIVPWYRKITDAVHKYDTKIFSTISHNERQNLSDITDAPVQSCSPIPFHMMGEVPMELEKEDIRDIIADYVAACRRAKEGGVDGIELHWAHGYLAMQFWSPHVNFRTDEYGGSLENRMRFSLELLDAVRKEVGESFVVGARISGDEMSDTGLGLADMIDIAGRLEKTGQLDFLDVSVGSYKTGALMIAPMMIPLPPFVYLASEIKQVIDIPVFTANRINDPVLANEIVKNNEADVVAMTRAQICDPEMVRKIREDRLDEIRVCMACNEGCAGRCGKGLPITCAQNPESGREGVLRIQPASQKKKVMIIGGGVAGLSAARVAALRGHDVSLYEKSSELGGQVLIEGNIDSRAEIKECVRNFEKELIRLPVTIKMGVEVTPEMAIAEGADEVIVATGALAIDDPSPSVVGPDVAVRIEPGAHVVTAWDVMADNVETGQRVLIYDVQFHIQGLIAAEKLLSQGREVELLMCGVRSAGGTSDGEAGTMGLQLYNVVRKGLKIARMVYVVQAFPGKYIGRHMLTGVKEELSCDTLVLSYWRKANADLYKTLKGKVKSLQRVGDCVSPRYITEAIHEGYMAGYTV